LLDHGHLEAERLTETFASFPRTQKRISVMKSQQVLGRLSWRAANCDRHSQAFVEAFFSDFCKTLYDTKIHVREFASHDES
jgi:hypothetical protein